MKVDLAPPSLPPLHIGQAPVTPLAPVTQLLLGPVARPTDADHRQRIEALALGGGWAALRELGTARADAAQDLQQRAKLAWQKLDPREVEAFAADHPHTARTVELLRQLTNAGQVAELPLYRSEVACLYLALIHGGLSGLCATAAAWPQGGQRRKIEPLAAALPPKGASPEIFAKSATSEGSPAAATSPLKLPAPQPVRVLPRAAPWNASQASSAARPSLHLPPLPLPPPPPSSPNRASAPAASPPPVAGWNKRAATTPLPHSPRAATAAATLHAASAKRSRPGADAAPHLGPRATSGGYRAAESADATSAVRGVHRRTRELRTPQASATPRQTPPTKLPAAPYDAAPAGEVPTCLGAAPGVRADPRDRRSAMLRHFQLDFPALGTVELAWPDLVTLLAERPPVGDARSRTAQVRINGIELRMATAELRTLVASLQPSPQRRHEP